VTFIITLFLVVFIFVLAFKPSKKRETIVKKDETTGKTIIETRTIYSDSAARTAARIVVKIVAISIAIVVVAIGCLLFIP
jgi:hypothetical protein